MSINAKDANDLFISVLGSMALWVGDNIFQLVGMACTIATLIFVARRYYRDAKTASLQQELLERQIKALGESDEK